MLGDGGNFGDRWKSLKKLEVNQLVFSFFLIFLHSNNLENLETHPDHQQNSSNSLCLAIKQFFSSSCDTNNSFSISTSDTFGDTEKNIFFIRLDNWLKVALLKGARNILQMALQPSFHSQKANYKRLMISLSFFLLF